MAGFSASEAIGAGFGLIRRNPLSVLVWGLFAVVLVYGPLIPLYASIVPAYIEMLSAGGPAGETVDFSKFAAMEGHLFGTFFWIWPLSLVATTINIAAVFRAVLEPNNRGFAYLRLGMQEVWLFLLLLLESLLALVFMAAVGLVIALACVATFRFSGGAMATIVGMAVGLMGALLLAWIWLRLCLAAPMTFADRKLRLFESWSLTRGHAGQLFLLALLLVAVLSGLGMVIQVVEGAPFLFFNPYAVNPDAVRAWLAHPPSPSVWAPWAAVAALVAAAYGGAVRAIMSAPWAAAYRAVRGET